MHQSNFEYAEQLVAICRQKGLVVTTAESCTGGGVAQAITAVPGSSAVLDCGYVTYSNSAKSDLLGVPSDVIASQGAVSKATVEAMSQGSLNSRADLTIALSGIAGPTGGTATKPVGTVWFAWRSGTQLLTEKNVFAGDRDAIRERATYVALTGLIAMANRLPANTKTTDN